MIEAVEVGKVVVVKTEVEVEVKVEAVCCQNGGFGNGNGVDRVGEPRALPATKKPHRRLGDLSFSYTWLGSCSCTGGTLAYAPERWSPK